MSAFWKIAFWKKKSPDPKNPAQMNDPSTIPGVGTRWANNLPLYIIGTLILVFLLVVVGVGVQRSNQGKQTPVAPTPQAANSSANLASELTAPYRDGIIPSGQSGKEAAPTDPKPDQAEDPQGQGQEQNQTGLSLPPSESESGPDMPVNQWAIYQERFESLRFAAFEAALKSPTSVQTDIRPSSSLEDTRARLRDTQRELEMAGDPNAVYQARMAALQGMDIGTEIPSGTVELSDGRGQTGDPSRFARSNTWKLDSQVELPEPYTVQAGAVIPAIMISGIVSDLPGQVMAQVSTNVYDSPTGRHLLIPQGTRLVGTYDNQIAYGQRRVLMAWQRLLFPDGRTLDIQAMPGADSAGKSGFEDRVNTHFWRIFGSSVLLSGVVAGVSLSQDTGDYDSDRQRASDALSEALGQNLGSAIAEMLRKSINISPTIEIRPGYRFNVMVTKDMVFSGPYRMMGQ